MTVDRRAYLDVHVIQTVPPANLNRDDQGNPKEAYFGGVRRARVSSQAWKRATRTELASHVPELERGTRTKRIAAELASRLGRTGVDGEQAQRLASFLLAPLGIKAGKKAGDTAYLLFYGHRQLEDVVDLVAHRAPELAALDDDALTTAVKDLAVVDKLKTGHPMEVALFGRMVADIASLNVDASVQVAHALSTHPVELEFDYYTAVDDQNLADETGAGMIGDIGFNSATLYRYATVGLHQLHANLTDTDAALTAAAAFVRDFARSMPTGYQNAFAHRTLPSMVAVMVRTEQPVNLVSAFEEPVTVTDGIAAASAVRLAEEYQRITNAWGGAPVHTAVCHTFDEKSPAAGRIREILGAASPFPQLTEGLAGPLAAAMGWDRTA
ncbi:type I-E CRISPR-associated protein Cas7/Cse4/CasC [Yinghuangia sp. ASG 101]|uniref:type I-E CRISPR-associated protein Cas7/Cse4/CasC n=1 Tax=Yinghuangia sp. ASG 101 TaxID=2896848 RepID=UPI001E472200|nr:type I-E CRISPR-associated protein Cas7/Cse4/CasC [Yinghuangia sp. ASG 101]UGQ10911.1 type I-E CRISPR-associated protein Cas7/Cse4/CasC [Yinghuangia sp. ASG 101]